VLRERCLLILDYEWPFDLRQSMLYPFPASSLRCCSRECVWVSQQQTQLEYSPPDTVLATSATDTAQQINVDTYSKPSREPCHNEVKNRRSRAQPQFGRWLSIDHLTSYESRILCRRHAASVPVVLHLRNMVLDRLIQRVRSTMQAVPQDIALHIACNHFADRDSERFQLLHHTVSNSPPELNQ
jgi:hypothetical protein